VPARCPRDRGRCGMLSNTGAGAAYAEKHIRGSVDGVFCVAEPRAHRPACVPVSTIQRLFQFNHPFHAPPSGARPPIALSELPACECAHPAILPTPPRTRGKTGRAPASRRRAHAWSHRPQRGPLPATLACQLSLTAYRTLGEKGYCQWPTVRAARRDGADLLHSPRGQILGSGPGILLGRPHQEAAALQCLGRLLRIR
jgi:hypothetical protein